MSTETWIALTSGSLPFAFGAQPLQLTMMTHSFPHYCYSLLIMVTQGLLGNCAVNLPVNWALFLPQSIVSLHVAGNVNCLQPKLAT